MSIATVSTNKLPFAIQTILGNDGKQRKISKWERSVCESNLSRRNCDKSYLPQHFVSNSIGPYHFPCQSIKTAFEITSSLSSTDHSKFISNPLLPSGTEVQNYHRCSHLLFHAQCYSPIRYGFASTSVTVPNRLAQSNKFSSLSTLSDAKFGKFTSNQLCFICNSDLPDSKIVKNISGKQTVSRINLNCEHDGFYSEKNPPSFPFVIASLACTAIDCTGSNSEKPQKAKPQNSSTTPPRIGYCSQSRILGHKKPRASFTKKQVALLESRFLAQKYLASTERVNLANQLEMSDMQVKTWFQNRRTKWRRQEAEEKEHEDKMMTRYPKCFFARPDIVL